MLMVTNRFFFSEHLLQDAVAAGAATAADHQRQLQRRRRRGRNDDQRRLVSTVFAAPDVDVVQRRDFHRRRRRSDATKDLGRHFVDGRPEIDPGQFRDDPQSDFFRFCCLKTFFSEKFKFREIATPSRSSDCVSLLLFCRCS